MPVMMQSIIASLMAGFLVGGYAGYQYSEGQQAIKTTIEERAIKASNKATASAIAAIEVKNTTIYQRVQKHVKTDPVYRSASCVHSADVMRELNAALTE